MRQRGREIREREFCNWIKWNELEPNVVSSCLVIRWSQVSTFDYFSLSLSSSKVSLFLSFSIFSFFLSLFFFFFPPVSHPIEMLSVSHFFSFIGMKPVLGSLCIRDVSSPERGRRESKEERKRERKKGGRENQDPSTQNLSSSFSSSLFLFFTLSLFSGSFAFHFLSSPKNASLKTRFQVHSSSFIPVTLSPLSSELPHLLMKKMLEREREREKNKVKREKKIKLREWERERN